MALKFEILKKHGKSRLGKLYTKHGVVNTPAFMPVGTCATVKAMLPESVASTGAEIILGNTYHLMFGTVYMRLESASFFGDFSEFRQAHHLKSA